MSFKSWAWKGLRQIKQADYFGVNLNFKFNNHEKYRSVFGGVVFVTYFLFAISYIMLNFQNFINRKTMNLVFNEGYQEKAPEINFSNYTVEFALGLTTRDPAKFSLLYKYFDISFNAVSIVKNNGTSTTNKTLIPLVSCQQDMFYNLVNNSFSTLGINNFFCPNISKISVQGIYTESVFKYFEFITSLKREFYSNTTDVKNLFMTDEIQANFFYIDTSFSAYNYSQPIQYFLNNKFVTLDFGFFKKVNLDFMEMTWISDANILFQEGDSSYYVVLDTFQEYFSNLGLDRFEKKVRDYQFFSKIYIRSSTRTRLIKRVYTKITEYLAQMSSILSSTLLILYVIVSYLNLFKAQQSIMKKIMKFKENINIKNGESISYLKNKFMNISSNGGIVANCLNLKTYSNLTLNRKEVKHQSIRLNNKFKMDDINFSGGFLNISSNQFQNVSDTNASKNLETNLDNQQRKTTNNECNLNTSSMIPINNNLLKIPDLNKKNKTFKESEQKEPSFNITRRNTKVKTERKTPIFRKLSRNVVDKENFNSPFKKEQITMNYNVCQILLKTICCCFQGNKYRMKQKLFERGYKKFCYDMDILTYIRKMHEMDILKYLILNAQQITLFNFLSKPSVSLISKNELIDSLPEKFDVKFDKEEIDALHKNFNEMIVCNYQSKFDKKLLTLVASEIDNLTM